LDCFCSPRRTPLTTLLNRSQAFTSFLTRISPTRVKQTTKLVSSDSHSNTANVKTTFVCDIVPLEKDDLVICDKKGSSAAGFLRGRLALVTRVSSNVRLVSAAPARGDRDKIPNLLCELTQDNYWKGEPPKHEPRERKQRAFWAGRFGFV